MRSCHFRSRCGRRVQSVRARALRARFLPVIRGGLLLRWSRQFQWCRQGWTIGQAAAPCRGESRPCGRDPRSRRRRPSPGVRDILWTKPFAEPLEALAVALTTSTRARACISAPRYIIRCKGGGVLVPPLSEKSPEAGAVIRCPECSAEIDVDEDEVEEGEILSCPECESELEVSQTHPVHLNVISDDLDEEEEEEEDGVGENGDLAEVEEDDDEEDDDDEE